VGHRILGEAQRALAGIGLVPEQPSAVMSPRSGRSRPSGSRMMVVLLWFWGGLMAPAATRRSTVGRRVRFEVRRFHAGVIRGHILARPSPG